MAHSKRSRIGLLPRWQRWSSHLILTGCAASGAAFFFKREMGLALWDVPAHTWLVWHGVTAALAWCVMGSVLPGHVRSGWNARRNRATGVTLIAVMVALMASGLLLYYGNEEARDTVVWWHWVIGFVSVAAFPLHLLVGRWLRRAPKQASKPAPSSA